MVEAVRYAKEGLQMPPDGKLPPEEIAVFEKWVSLGLPDPRSPSDNHRAPPLAGMSIEEGRAFWSFRPVVDPPLPASPLPTHGANPIDLFLDRARTDAGLTPAPPLEPRAWIRRVTFDVTGLPPTKEEVDQFLQLRVPDAAERSIDRLLASASYGLRWGRHWLDVARYADSNGLDENLALGQAWRYRDYVVDAFNADKPFDRFVVEQVAGDLLPDASTESRIATGFLVLGAKVLAEPDREKLTMDTVDEQLDTLGKTFWGMTIGCVRCHDHKFDPIKQSDYYGLAAIFKSTKTFGDTHTGAIKHWNEFPLASDEETAQLQRVDEEIARRKDTANKFKSSAMEKIRGEAKAKAAEYLIAAASLDADATLVDAEKAAEPFGLHPRILAHARRHLDFHREDPLFTAWHTYRSRGDWAGLRLHYETLWNDVAAACKFGPVPLSDPRCESARLALEDPSGFLAVPPKVEFAFDAETLAEYHRLAEEARLLESQSPDLPAAMGVQDQTILTSLPIHVRGSHLQLGEPVPRTFPTVMTREGKIPELASTQSGRLELARWMVNPDHPLTMRVIVNRIWRWHFGQGIVPSVDNFGKLGDLPSHPELLDWLACRLAESDYSVKHLHRLILSSSAYRQSSFHPEPSRGEEVDPDNRLLWKARLTRLEAEQWRDALLAVSGRLDDSVGGKTVPLRNRQFVFDHTSIDHTRYHSLRRAIYLPIIRNNLYPFFEQFDFPDPTMPTGSRHSTTVAPQALLLLNSDLVLDAAEDLGHQVVERTTDERARVTHLYETVLGRLPNPEEIERAQAFVHASEVGPAAGWALLSQSLLLSNEFMYVR
jgi:hypothetical protein